jgi:phosphoserine phosphatase
LLLTVNSDVLAVFDLDHTLVPHDSDEQWVAFLVEEGTLDREQWDSANRELIARFNRGEAGTIEFTEFYLSTLTRFDDATLSRLALALWLSQGRGGFGGRRPGARAAASRCRRPPDCHHRGVPLPVGVDRR